MSALREFLRQCMLLYKRILNRIAFTFCSTDPNLVFFESYQGRGYSCSPKAMYEAVEKDSGYSDFHFVWAFRDVEKHAFLRSHRDTGIVRFESFKYYRMLARAKYWVFNSNPRPFLTPKKDQVFIQTWHGTPLKRVGCDVILDGNAVTKAEDIYRNYMREGRKISFMISPSEYCSKRLVSAFRLDDAGRENIVLTTGYPRNDMLFTFTDRDVEKVKERYKIPSNKNVILYAPTFRDNSHSLRDGYVADQLIDFNRMAERLSGRYVILFRTHYFISKRFDFSRYNGFVIDVSDVEDINELYIASDILITDYSSVFFDYANLFRPVFFYMPDYEEYKRQIRDFYLDISSLPGSVCSTQDELEDGILSLPEHFEPDERYRKFHDTFNALDGPDCAIRAARAVIKPGMP